MLPSEDSLREVLASSVCSLRSGTRLIRAAWHEAGALCGHVARAHRWGPPERYRGANGRLPFHWLYVAEDPATAAWEGRLCVNDSDDPGRFTIVPGAEDALLVDIELGSDLTVFELGGFTAARLGIYDQLSHPKYRWCQDFGVALHHAMIALHDATGVVGIRYPSRRLRNHSAIAIHSAHLPTWREAIDVRCHRFGDLPIYRALLGDPCYRAVTPAPASPPP